MKKRPLCLITSSLLLIVTHYAAADTCRSGSAAISGAQAGYESEVNQINQQADNSRTSSDLMGKCISGVTGVIVMPTFPDLGSIWQQMIDKVCRTASESISNVTNDAISNVNSQISGLMGGVTNGVNSVTNSAVNQATAPLKSNIDYGSLW